MRPAAALWVLALAIAGCDGDRFEHQEIETFRFDGDSAERIELRIDAGRISLSPASGSDVEVVVTKRVRAADRERAKTAAGHLSLHHRTADDTLWLEARTLAASLEGTRLRGRTDIDLRIPETIRYVDVRTRDGRVAIEDLAAEVHAETGDGRIRAVGVSRRSTLRSEDGSITVRRAEGDLDVATGDGRIVISGRLDSLRAATHDGRIRVEAESSPGASWDIRTLDGSITLVLPEDAVATLDASAAEGRVELDADDFQGTARKSRVKGDLRGGGHRILVSTLDGTVRIESP